MARKVNLGLLGCGVVGNGLVSLIERNRVLVSERSGLDLVVRRALVRDLRKERTLDPSLLTDDPEKIFQDADIDVVVEIMGGEDPAFDYVMKAIENGKNVVTANKALLARSGGDILRKAVDRKCRVGFEASVCGGLPLIRALQHGLVGNRIHALCGIINGTNNFILTQMSEKGLTFDEALALAQERGFCEADPSLDLDGIDAAQKLVVLSELAFGAEVPLQDVSVEGIRTVTAEDIRRAKSLGFVIKHVAIAREVDDRLDLRVRPMFLPGIHPLAGVRNEYNGVLVRGDAVGDMMFEGKGAGSLPTASAVLSDIIEVAGDVDNPVFHLPPAREHALMEESTGSFYLRFPIVDLPGVLGLITTALGNHEISISHATAVLSGDPSCLTSAEPGEEGHLAMMVHRCSETQLRNAVEEIARLPVLKGKPVVLGILDEGTL